MKINKEMSNNKMDVWECECGTITPIKKGSPKPSCEYCRRVEMKRETDLAKENVRHKLVTFLQRKVAEGHLASCQREHEFLKYSLYPQLLFEGNTNGKDLVLNRIKNLKSAIKIYSDEGIQ